MTLENSLLVSVLLTLVGILIIIIRKSKLKEKANEYILDSMEWLIIGTAPLFPAVELLATHRDWSTIFIIGYISIIVSWFIIFWLTKKENPKKAKQAAMYIVPIFVGMIIFVILTWQAILKL